MTKQIDINALLEDLEKVSKQNYTDTKEEKILKIVTKHDGFVKLMDRLEQVPIYYEDAILKIHPIIMKYKAK